MKPTFLKVFSSFEASIDIRHEIDSHFKNPWHFHPELELTLILEGRGTHFIGDRICNFDKNELTLIGPNLPHFWRCDPIFYKKDHNLKAEAIIIRFPKDFLGCEFLHIPEMNHIDTLFKISQRGLKITGDSKERTIQIMKAMLQMDGAERIIALLQILNSLAHSSEYETLSSIGFEKTHITADIERIDKVFTYLVENFMRPIRLKEIAMIANMNPAAFSRYFKTKTGKTFTEVLQEIRIGHACKTLIDGDSSVAQVCYECGYENESYFIGQFKRITYQTPLQYRNQHKKELLM